MSKANKHAASPCSKTPSKKMGWDEDSIHKTPSAVSWGVNLCRLLVGAVFSFSGFVKLLDPVGVAYKIEEYLSAFSLPLHWFSDFQLFSAATALAVLEFTIGMLLLLGIRRGLSTLAAWVFMLFFTPVTLYTYLTQTVAHCGCFGDVLVLSPGQTFGKNLLLLLLCSLLLWGRQYIRPLFHIKNAAPVAIFVIVYALALCGHCLWHLPVVEFLPFTPGKSLNEIRLEAEQKAQQTTYTTYFLMEKDGVKKEFTTENYPDSTWHYIGMREMIKGSASAETPLWLTLQEVKTGEEVTAQLEESRGYAFLLTMPAIEKANMNSVDRVNEAYDFAVMNHLPFYAATASGAEVISRWEEETGAEYPILHADITVLKSITRSNPGLVLLHDGVICKKWSSHDIPREQDLPGVLQEMSKQESRSSKPSTSLTILQLLAILLLPITLLWWWQYPKKRSTSGTAHENDAQNKPQNTPKASAAPNKTRGQGRQDV